MNNTPNFSFSPSELSVLHDKQFFQIKHAVTHKWELFLSHLAENIQKWFAEMVCISLPDEVKQTTPKISKGENYQGMPYMVLDYPRYFGKEDTFAFRNILLWSRGLYSTWFFEGKYIDYAIKTYPKHGKTGMYLHQNPDKWIHELTEQDIYIPIPQNAAEKDFLIQECLTLLQNTQNRLNYLKFTNFLSFQDWNTLHNAEQNVFPAVQNCFRAFSNFIFSQKI